MNFKSKKKNNQDIKQKKKDADLCQDTDWKDNYA